MNIYLHIYILKIIIDVKQVIKQSNVLIIKCKTPQKVTFTSNRKQHSYHLINLHIIILNLLFMHFHRKMLITDCIVFSQVLTIQTS